jgi:hypothetical protein
MGEHLGLDELYQVVGGWLTFEETNQLFLLILSWQYMQVPIFSPISQLLEINTAVIGV